MPEFRDRYDTAAVSGRISQPPFAELADRGRRRGHRTRIVRVAGVTAVAALAAAPLLTAPGGSESLPPAESPPPSERTWGRGQISVDFFDTDFGVAHYVDRADASCDEGWFSVTRDGGATWSELVEVPRVPDQISLLEIDGEQVCLKPSVLPIGPGTLLAEGPWDMLSEWPFFISHDAGRTWQQYQPQLRTAESVPDGVIPDGDCEDEACQRLRLSWWDPVTGDRMVLRNAPPAMADIVTVAPDGSIWLHGLVPGGDSQNLSVSRDRGRSWLDRTPGEDIDIDLGFAGFMTPDGTTAYLYPLQSPIEPAPFELYRTTDGGETWHEVPAVQRFGEVGSVWTTRDGGLVVEDDGDLYLSTDGGATFARTDLPARNTWALPGGGLLAWPRDRAAVDPVDLYLSEDGLTWQPVEVPHYPGPDEESSVPPSPAG